ncbi:hypothetical protein CYMTET_17903 [Cymbomonas tetramitiformis]|uniref:Uncharacterized protein n=1 Tax=Cymbomonas tetramitiformis TaxID=36881 RepID=A0AAE0CD18_9CHLO|nr:hypothetical protein CYMTET_37868 [Cymbomonas tetramitiformis]KAK3273883.1 hypothetical protein CYMTET_17903 [Cymbomonas tetramitiformis]
MPRSYWVNYTYFDSIYEFHGKAYNVLYSPKNWTAVTERFSAISQVVLQTQSVNLYDSATMMIALGMMDKADTRYSDEAYDYGVQWLKYLLSTDTFELNYVENLATNNRGPTYTDYNYLYGNLATSIAGSDGYMYREVMEYYYTDGIPNNWCVVLQTNDTTKRWANSYHQKCGSVEGWYKYQDTEIITRNAKNQLYYTYDDFKPITGEHSWGRILGPLLFDEFTGSDYGFRVAFKAWQAVRAMMVALQEKNGQYLGHVMYYMPLPTVCTKIATPPDVDSDDASCIDGRTFSSENLASTIAAVRKLESVVPSTTVLSYVRNTTKPARDASTVRVKHFLHEMDQNLTSGYLNVCLKSNVTLYTNKQDKSEETRFECSPCVIQGGLVTYNYDYWDQNKTPKTQDEPSEYSMPRINSYFAVDVHTWGLSVLATDIRDAYNLTVPFELWRQVRRYGGYKYTVTADNTNCDETVSGVGYTYPNQNETGHEVVTGEWTLGALFAVRTLRQMYSTNNCTQGTGTTITGYEYAIYEGPVTFDTSDERIPPVKKCSKKFTKVSDFCAFAVKQLVNDEINMLKTLRGELTVELSDMSSNGLGYTHQIGRSATALYYNNLVHYNIPFGWYAERNPSMASTAWMMYADEGINPMRVDVRDGGAGIPEDA